MDIILASASPRRKLILEKLGYTPQIIKSDAKESHFDLFPPYTPIKNAIIKTEAVAKHHPKSLVIGSDTVIEFNNKILGKPCNMQEATAMLLKFSGQTHEVITAVSIICIATKVRIVFAETSEVTFKQLTEADIQAYFAKVNPLDKAGAYGIQEHGDIIIKCFTGELENIMGLPKARTHQALQHALELT